MVVLAWILVSFCGCGTKNIGVSCFVVNIIFTKVMFTDLASVILVVISLNIFLFWSLTNALGYVSMGEARAGERREV